MTATTKLKSMEREAQAQRAELLELLTAIGGQIAPGAMANHALQLAQDGALPAARQAGAMLRRHPLAAALTAAGLAWLLLGRRSEADAQTPSEAPADPLAEGPAQAVSDEWADEIDRLRRAASERLHALEAEAGRSADAARDLATERAEMLADFAQDLRARLAEGLGALNEDTRAGIIAAREAAYAARVRAQASAEQAGSDARKFVQEHPLVTVALGLAVGAAIGAAARGPRH